MSIWDTFFICALITESWLSLYLENSCRIRFIAMLVKRASSVASYFLFCSELWWSECSMEEISSDIKFYTFWDLALSILPMSKLAMLVGACLLLPTDLVSNYVVRSIGTSSSWILLALFAYIFLSLSGRTFLIFSCSEA